MEKTYEVYATENFWEDYDKLSKVEKIRIDKIKDQLRLNPYTGKPLGYRFFREKRFDGKRLYYIIYEDYVVVLVVAYSDKKTQQTTIDGIKKAFDFYRQEVYDKFSKK